MEGCSWGVGLDYASPPWTQICPPWTQICFSASFTLLRSREFRGAMYGSERPLGPLAEAVLGLYCRERAPSSD